jgi:hypothetical protein
MHLFHVEHTIKQIMVMLTRTVYEHCEEAGPTLPLTVGSHRNRRVCRATPHSDDICYTDKHEQLQSIEDEHTYLYHCSIQ